MITFAEGAADVANITDSLAIWVQEAWRMKPEFAFVAAVDALTTSWFLNCVFLERDGSAHGPTGSPRPRRAIARPVWRTPRSIIFFIGIFPGIASRKAWEGEAPAELLSSQIQGSAGASPSRATQGSAGASPSQGYYFPVLKNTVSQSNSCMSAVAIAWAT